MKHYNYVQNIEKIEKIYAKQDLESKKYRGRIPKRKRIRNKIQKQRENKELPYIHDKFHY
ncbi:hypothetical protein [Staphylococcus epidermidis]|uniref:hypothetical protein n=1 Tax=Staphylococcus epidermidis TaxID=1282 RepID=UPI000E07C73D|nr:hypothetical protein [Staphylococcus epidermidis]SUM50513.1 Uncharacterised protein [Staphylococcus epidermidis]